jgi:hypothetical protein
VKLVLGPKFTMNTLHMYKSWRPAAVNCKFCALVVSAMTVSPLVVSFVVSSPAVSPVVSQMVPSPLVLDFVLGGLGTGGVVSVV